MNTNKTILFQVEIDREQYTELQKLMQETGTRTIKHFTNNAFALLKWAIRKSREGSSIVAMNKELGTYIELEMPILEVIVPDTEKRYGKPE